MEEPFTADKNKQKYNILNIKNILILSNIILIIIAIELYFVISDGKIKNQNINDENIITNRKIIFQQPEENAPAKYILVHIPEKEIFMSTLHPAASLYEDVTDYIKVKECFDNLKKILKDKNIELITVRSALKLNKTALKKLAFNALKYEIDNETKIETNIPEHKIFMN